VVEWGCLARDWWINIHHLRVRHILRNVWVSVVNHPLWVRVAKKHWREGARLKGIWTRMWCELDECGGMDMFRTLCR